MSEGVEFPPLVVFRNWNREGWSLLDGANRTNAYVALGVHAALAYEFILDGLSLPPAAAVAAKGQRVGTTAVSRLDGGILFDELIFDGTRSVRLTSPASAAVTRPSRSAREPGRAVMGCARRQAEAAIHF